MARWIDSARPLLEKLSDLRNGLIAHLDTEVILDPQEMSRTVAVTFEDIEAIMDIATEIVTNVLNAYINSTYVDKLLSVEDCDALLRTLESSDTPPPPPGNRSPSAT